jgi:hypothetical protein
VSLEDIVVSVVSAWVHRLSGMTIEHFLHADQWAWKTAIWSGTGVLTVSALYLRHLHIDRSAQWRLDAVADNERPMDIGQPSIGASVRFLTDQTIPWRGQERLFSVASRLSAAARRMAPSRRFWPFARRGRPIELIRRRYGGRRGDRQPVVAVSIRV